MGVTRMACTRLLASMVGGPRPWGCFRSVNHPVGGPTGQPVEPEPTKTTKDRLVVTPPQPHGCFRNLGHSLPESARQLNVRFGLTSLSRLIETKVPPDENKSCKKAERKWKTYSQRLRIMFEKDIYNGDVELRADFTSLKGRFRLVGWQLSALTAVILFMGSAIIYFIDKVEKYFPAAVVAVLAEKNHMPTPPTIETPASTLPPKTGK
ncbi:hypothetical protein HOY82DRAFT_650599 [Tuber indicum]|nr:hypothetical protein HOY82DRAFT_650599 [Tuber indicum]